MVGAHTLLPYMARPPLAHGWLMLRENGKVLWNLRRPWRDATRGFVFDPSTFIRRLAALVRHAREHQLSCHGSRAPASPQHDLVVLRLRCGGRHHMLAAITDGGEVRSILAHLGLPTEPLPIAPAREPSHQACAR